MRRLPGILAEVVSVIFAVLVALAVDEWWEERENTAMADRMVDAIAEEIRGNRAELLDAGGPGGQEDVTADLGSAIATLREGREPQTVQVDWDVALLSSGAWEAARVSGATQHMELDRLIALAQLYELQRLYADVQDDLVSLIADIPAGMEQAPVQTLLSVQSRFTVAADLRDNLATLYACSMAELDGPDAWETADCPRR